MLALALVFSMHLPSEPSHLDPSHFGSSDANYLHGNLMRGLYRYDNDKGLEEEGAKKCIWENPLRLRCELNERVKWSNGQPVHADDYVRAFRRVVSASAKGLGIELLRSLKNALSIYKGENKNVESLGVEARDSQTLLFYFTQPDSDFLYKLTSSNLVPIAEESPTIANAAKLLCNGPYQIESWRKGRSVKLRPNPHYPFGSPARPPVEVFFIDDDFTAMNMYRAGQLQFVRRVPFSLIDSLQSSPGFFQTPLARFDYLGFGPELKNLPQLRKALSLSLDYEELGRLFRALGRPGCPSLPESYLDQPRCYDFNPQAARKALSEVPKEFLKKRWKVQFSKLGGDDHRQTMEWLQAQWKKNLGLQVDIEQIEQGVFVQRLRIHPPHIFRKGIGLDRPTCLSALETFLPGGLENYLKLDLPPYIQIVEKLRKATAEKEKQKLCGQAVQTLLNDHWLIPMGRLHFSMLLQPRFKGLKINEMNQLDLSHLQVVGP